MRFPADIIVGTSLLFQIISVGKVIIRKDLKNEYINKQLKNTDIISSKDIFDCIES